MTTNHITQAMANPEIIVELGRRFKEYRLTYRLTQKEAAEKAGVSLITLRQFENGKAYNINMGNFLALLRVVDVWNRWTTCCRKYLFQPILWNK